MSKITQTIFTFLAFLFSSILPSSSPPPPSPPPPPLIHITEFDTYRVYWFPVDPSSSLTLHSNFPQTQSSTDLMNQYHCTCLINAGFYSKQHQHIGLFVSDHQLLSPFQTNSLFNGILSLSSANSPQISTSPPEPLPPTALQTGPILVLNHTPQTLHLTNDPSTRRSFALITTNRHLILALITSIDSTTTGPFLTQLPQIISQFAHHAQLSLDSAINLDGGTASAILDSTTHIHELNPIGAFFCLH